METHEYDVLTLIDTTFCLKHTGNKKFTFIRNM